MFIFICDRKRYGSSDSTGGHVRTTNRSRPPPRVRDVTGGDAFPSFFGDDRGVTPVIGIVLIVAVTLVISASVAVAVLDVTDDLTEPQEPRLFGDADVLLGAEHRSWSGWNDDVSDPDRGDVDAVRLTYKQGPIFEGDEIGSILVRWEGSDGEGGQVRFLNPNRFGEDTEQEDHDADVGKFATGTLRAGDELTIRMAHNRYDDGGETSTTESPFSYVESNDNDVARNNDEPLFRVENRYPVLFEGDRPMDPGDSVEVRFLGPEDEQPIATVSTTARAASGEPAEWEKPEID